MSKIRLFGCSWHWKFAAKRFFSVPTEIQWYIKARRSDQSPFRIRSISNSKGIVNFMALPKRNFQNVTNGNSGKNL